MAASFTFLQPYGAIALSTSHNNVVEVEYKGEVTELNWFLVDERNLIFSPTTSIGNEMLWIGQVHLHDNPYDYNEQYRRVLFRREIGQLLVLGNFQRLIPIDSKFVGPAMCWGAVSLTACGIMYCSIWRQANWDAKIEWKGDEREFLNAPLDVVQGLVNHSIESNEQEWTRVVEWSKLNSEARFWSLVSWQRGNKDEWESLIRAAISLAIKKGKIRHPVGWQIQVAKEAVSSCEPLQLEKRMVAHDLSPDSIIRLVELLQPYFDATINYNRLGAALKNPFPWFSTSVIIGAKPFTSHHELMQALDLWRDFGRKINQLVRVEELLRELLA